MGFFVSMVLEEGRVLLVRKESMAALLLFFLLAVSAVSADEGELHLLSMVCFYVFFFLCLVCFEQL